MLLRQWRRLPRVAANIHFLELVFSDSTCLPLILIIEALRINEDLDDDVTDTTFDQVFEVDAARQGGASHIK